MLVIAIVGTRGAVTNRDYTAWRTKHEPARLALSGGPMFNDLFHLVELLDHDFREEHGERVHSYTCRRCEIALRLKSFKDKIRRLLRDVDFDVGDPGEEKKVSKDSDHR